MSAATPQEQILGIVNNHWQSCCVGAAVQLELADLLLARRSSRRAHEDPRAEPVSAATSAGEHGNLHSNHASRIRQYAGERLPPPQLAGIQLGMDSLHALFWRSGVRGMAWSDAVLEARASRLRSGDGQERVGAHAIGPGDVHDLQPGHAGLEHVDQSGSGHRLGLEPIPCDRRYRRRNRVAVVEASSTRILRDEAFCSINRTSLRRRRSTAASSVLAATSSKTFPSRPTLTSCDGYFTIGRTRNPLRF